MSWEPSNYEPSNEYNVVRPSYNFGGQTVQWGEMWAGENSYPGYTDTYYLLAFVQNGQPFDVLQWFIDQYGISGIHEYTEVFFYDDSGLCDANDAIFFIRHEYYNSRHYFGAGFYPRGSHLVANNPPHGYSIHELTFTGYAYNGCDLNNIREIDHQLASLYIYRHVTFASGNDASDYDGSLTPDSCYSIMPYDIQDQNGNYGPLTGPKMNTGHYVEGITGYGDGWLYYNDADSTYRKTPSGGGAPAWGTGSPPAFMYSIIDNFLEDDTTTGGGDGDYGFYSDSIGFSDVPEVGFEDTGFCRMFAPTLLEIQSLAAFMWSDSFLDNIKGFSERAMDSIINLGAVPVDLSSVRGAQISAKVGNVPTGVALSPLTEQYITVEFGHINIKECWGTYLDYAETAIECYLPFVGYVQINTAELMGKKSEGGGKISLIYNVNLFSGEFIAQLRFNNRGFDNVLQQFSGSMMYSCPFSAASYSSFYKNILGDAVNFISNVATGNVAGAISAGVSAAVDSVQLPTVQRSGAISGGSSVMGGFTPYLILRQPVQHLDASGYAKLEGFPSYVYRQLSNVSGFVKIEAIKLDGFTGTEEEARELEEILKGGIYL